jgi:phospholipase/carboxylesterase
MLLLATLVAMAAISQTGPSVPIAGPALGAVVAARNGRLVPIANKAVAYVPATIAPHPPLLVLLHGAGRRWDRMIEWLAPEANQRGIVLLAPISRGMTWDIVGRAEEPPSDSSPLANRMALRFSTSGDAERIDAAIAQLTSIVPIDRARTALAGFSDGATFALAMGMSRSYSFSAVIAWSPGIAISTAAPAAGRKVYISHGREDPVLSFTTDCTEIVPLLQSERALVTFQPFHGGHEIPPSVTEAFLDAIFGPARGEPPRPLAMKTETCIAAPPDIPDRY